MGHDKIGPYASARYGDEGAGKELFAEISRRDLEGIVAKRKTGLYRDDRPDWLKVKNRSYSQAEGRHVLLNRTRKR